MGNKALILKLDETIDDVGLEHPVIGGLTVEFYKRGDGSGLSTIQFSVSTENVELPSLSISGGELFADSGGTVSLGKTYTAIAGSNILYMKCQANKGRLLFKKIASIISFGSTAVKMFAPIPAVGTNSAYCKVDVSKLSKDLIILEPSAFCVFEGDLAYTFNKMSIIRYFNMIQTVDNVSTNVYGDLTDPSKITINSDIQVFNLAGVKTTKDLKVSIDLLRPVQRFILSTGKLYGALSNIKSTVTYYDVSENVEDHTTGMLNDVPSAANWITIRNNPNLSYAGGRSWATNFIRLDLRGTPLSSAVIDVLLNELAETTWSSSTAKLIMLKGIRTSASDAAYTKLIGLGIPISINP